MVAKLAWRGEEQRGCGLTGQRGCQRGAGCVKARWTGEEETPQFSSNGEKRGEEGKRHPETLKRGLSAGDETGEPGCS